MKCPDCENGEQINVQGTNARPCPRCGATGERQPESHLGTGAEPEEEDEDDEGDPDAQAKYERDEIHLLEE